MNWTQQRDFMRSMPAVAAKILILLLWTERNLTSKELETAVDASDKTIKQSTDWLAERGLLQDNGRYHGWSLPVQPPLPYKKLWQGHSGIYLESESAPTGQTQETARSSQVTAVDSQDNQPSGSPQNIVPESEPDGGEIGNSDPLLINWLIKDPLLEEKDLINQPINQNATGNSDLKRVMRSTKPPITGKVFSEFCQKRVDAGLVLAWYWWCLGQSSWIDEPVGYVIQRVRPGEMPPADHLALARFWLSLDSDGREDFHAAFWEGRAVDNLTSDFDLTPAAAELAVQLRPLKVFEE